MMHRTAGWMMFAAACGVCAEDPALRRSDVVFMYSAPSEAYAAYGATFVAWGGAESEAEVRRHREAGIRCTGSMWCLTAGAKLIHERPEIRAACAIDIEGNPVEVPWLFDHTHEGTKSYFGCTNHPEFRKLCRERVEQCMAGGADGLHVDDHLGVASAAWYFGGGLCDFCVAGFRGYLSRHASKEELQAAGVGDLATFDYRDLIRRQATTRAEYLKVRHGLPLMNHFLDFHAFAAAEHVKELGGIAEAVAGRPVLLSANAGLPNKAHTYVVNNLTHIICEVNHHAASGTRSIDHAIEAYDMAEAMGRPMASTAGGWDWAFVKANSREMLVRFWIALAYAHGQRFMVPHPARQWCFTDKLGTHWYEAPVEAYAPLYRFVRKHADLFDGYETAFTEGLSAPDQILATVRTCAHAGSVAIHLINRDYNPDADAMKPISCATVSLPAVRVPAGVTRARVVSFDGAGETIPVHHEGGICRFSVPEIRLWCIVVMEKGTDPPAGSSKADE